MPKILGFIVLFFTVIAALVILAGQIGLLRGKNPSDLGVHNGRLKPPSLTPNSVSSQANLYLRHPQVEYAQIEPLKYSGSSDVAIQRLAEILKSTPGTNLVSGTPDYLYARSRTPWLGFVDDIEFWADSNAGVIHVRSASRLGRKDFGVNRERVEKIRAQFETN